MNQEIINHQIIADKISDIIHEFVETPDGDKQCFDIYETDAYQELERKELTNETDVINLRITIENIVNSYEQLCNMFGDYDW